MLLLLLFLLLLRCAIHTICGIHTTLPACTDHGVTTPMPGIAVTSSPEGFVVRGEGRFPNLERWFDALETRPSYLGIKSDYYTHCHDLPPQLGGARHMHTQLQPHDSMRDAISAMQLARASQRVCQSHQYQLCNPLSATCRILAQTAIYLCHQQAAAPCQRQNHTLQQSTAVTARAGTSHSLPSTQPSSPMHLGRPPRLTACSQPPSWWATTPPSPGLRCGAPAKKAPAP